MTVQEFLQDTVMRRLLNFSELSMPCSQGVLDIHSQVTRFGNIRQFNQLQIYVDGTVLNFLNSLVRDITAHICNSPCDDIIGQRHVLHLLGCPVPRTSSTIQMVHGLIRFSEAECKAFSLMHGHTTPQEAYRSGSVLA
ncbi:hypothetical protein SK128_013316 [Halocaridina rubra]|uniref:Uncharacterized protein n=1 Tax=Halocaridina rubra TaxID=373956 RepID=A0AAN9ADS7_HALRR